LQKNNGKQCFAKERKYYKVKKRVKKESKFSARVQNLPGNDCSIERANTNSFWKKKKERLG